MARNTAPAIALAALAIAESDPDGLLLVMPSDHRVAAPETLLSAVAAASPSAAAIVGRARWQALTRPPGEQRGGRRPMREIVRNNNVYRWAGSMLLDAARLRKRGDLDKVTGAGATPSAIDNVISIAERKRMAI